MALTVRLFWLWRLFGTALSFLLFGLGGILTPLLVAPVLLLLPGGMKVRQKRARLVVHWLFRLFINIMRGLGIVRWKVDGLERLQRPGQLIVANHPTLLDVVFLVAFIPDATCLVKSRLLGNPVMRGFITITGYITNDNGASLIKFAGQALQAGSSVVVFPEGTRTQMGGGVRLQRGSANIAVRCQVDVTPVIIHCCPPTLSKEHRWYHIPDRPFVMSFRVLDNIRVTRFEESSKSLSSRKLTRYLEALFTKEAQ